MPHIATTLYLARDAVPGASPEFLLGSTLPGFMRLYREQLGSIVTHAELTQVADYEFGLDFGRSAERHINQSSAIQLQTGFTADDIALIPGLSRRDQAEMCAKEGLEMVRDGIIADWPATAETLAGLTDRLAAGTPALYEVTDHNFPQFVRHYLETRYWERYQSGVQVADILQRRYAQARYERFSFDELAVPRLAVIFDRQRDHIAKLGEMLLHDARLALRADGTYFSQTFADDVLS